MPPTVIVALIIGLPAVIIFWLRSNAAMTFLALCAGSVLGQFIVAESTNLANSLIPNQTTVTTNNVQLVLLYIPAFFTILFTRGKVPASKTIVNLILALAVGVVGVLLAVPLLPGGVSHNITNSDVWPSIEQYQSVIVAATVTLSLFTLWFAKAPKHDKKGKHHK